MNPVNREPMEDAATKRRKYLLARAGTSTLGCTGAFLACGFAVLTAIGAVAILMSILGLGYFPLAFTFSIVATAVSGIITSRSIQAVRNADQKAAQISYVPPVREQVANLPVEEVLLRGSHQPPASAEELVRAATFNLAIPETGLLRAADSESERTEQPVGGVKG
jgi:hypothetical protein